MPIQAPAWTDYLNCPVCCRDFGAPPRSPISLPCGHTICRHCLSHLHRRQCPFDQTIIQLDEDELVVNTALLQLAGYPPPPQPHHPPSVQALPEHERAAYDLIVRRLQELATYLKYCGNANSSSTGGRLSRPIQRKLVTLVQCAITDEEGRGRAARAARSLGERTVTELILQHQNPQQLSANLWAAVRARGCQFLGPAMQEEVLKLVLLALEDGSALSRKVLVMFVVQRLEPHFPQASKTSIGHVVQLLYRASCFKVSKRECDSSLMQLKDEFRTYESLRREHDAQIVQIATEAGLRIAPEQWSALLYGDTAHKSHMQSIIDKLQTPQSFAQSVQELFIALQRTGDPARLLLMSMHLDRLAQVDAHTDAKSPTWQQLSEILSSLREVVSGLVHYLQQSGRDPNHNKHPEHPSLPSPQGTGTPTHGKYKVSMCRDAAARSYCPRGNQCTFAHSEEERERYRSQQPPPPPTPVSCNGNFAFMNVAGRPAPAPLPLPTLYPAYPIGNNNQQHINNFRLPLMAAQPMAPMAVDFAEQPPPHEPIPTTTFPAPNIMNGQMLNGMNLNQNGLMFEAPLHSNLQANMAPPIASLPPNIAANMPYNKMAGQYTGLLAVTQHNQVAVPPAPSQPLPYPPLQMHQPMHLVPVPEPRDLSPYPFDELQSDLFSDSYRATTARYGAMPRSPTWPRTTDDVFNFDGLSSALPSRANTADDVFSVGVERMNVGSSASNATAYNVYPDDQELEEEIQALEGRLAKELDK
ncbi:roquin-1 isoform X1 [Plutella xylostella]|uniref:roquin-1 isoform X1 n=1 Tax=Plutella xylostella TaxID=51655 RepID=UPI002032F465|nr:roquin-1 isoform X1 [Plutella xylostella]